MSANVTHLEGPHDEPTRRCRDSSLGWRIGHVDDGLYCRYTPSHDEHEMTCSARSCPRQGHAPVHALAPLKLPTSDQLVHGQRLDSITRPCPRGTPSMKAACT